MQRYNDSEDNSPEEGGNGEEEEINGSVVLLLKFFSDSRKPAHFITHDLHPTITI